MTSLTKRILMPLIIVAAFVGQAHAKSRTYIVQPGDSIWSIAEEFYGSGDKYHLIYKHNAFIGLPPFILKPGQVLTLPEGELVPEAQVAWMQKEVKAKPPKSLDWLSASTKMNLWKLYQVSTGDESAVHIVFEDQSDLRLSDNALLVIYGGSKKRTKSEEREKTQVLLKEGTVRGGLAALDDTPGQPPAKPMVVETPTGLVEIQAQLVQIQANALAAIVSVYDGVAEVKSEGQSVKVSKGYGTVVEKGKAPEKPSLLPPPPGWSIAGNGTPVAIVPEGGRATFEAAWTKVAEAKTYRVELAQDEGFKQVIVNVQVGAEVSRFALQQIPIGTYWARIAARDARALEGSPSPALRIDVVGLRSSRRLTYDEAGGRWEVAGLVKLDLGDAAPGLEWALNGGAYRPGSEPARVEDTGPQEVRVRRVAESVETAFRFEALEVEAKLDTGPKTALRAGSDEKRVLTVEVTDARQRPAALPDLSVDASPGGELALVPAGPGLFTAELPAPPVPGPEFVNISVRWADGLLTSGRVRVDRVLPDMPYVYAWRPAGMGLAWDGRRAATPLPSVQPIDRVGTQVIFVAKDAETFGNIALVGELGLFDQRLALDAALTLFRPPMTRDAAQYNEAGDLVVGVRGVGYETPRFVLAPSLRARLPIADRAEGDLVGIEPSVLLRWRAGKVVWLETRQGIMAAVGDDGEMTWIGDYTVLARPIDMWSIGAQIGTAFLLSGGGETASLALGVTTQLHFDRVRVGLQIGLGLGAGGASRFGDFGGGLTLDFGLGTP